MDDEITGMFQVGKVLEGLDEEARARVLRWAADKFAIDLGQPVEAEEEAVESPDQTMFMLRLLELDLFRDDQRFATVCRCVGIEPFGR